MDRKTKAGWLKSSFEIFLGGAILLIIAYATVPKDWILIAFGLCLVIAIICVIGVILITREKPKKSKINWEEVPGLIKIGRGKR